MTKLKPTGADKRRVEIIAKKEQTRLDEYTEVDRNGNNSKKRGQFLEQ